MAAGKRKLLVTLHRRRPLTAENQLGIFTLLRLIQRKVFARVDCVIARAREMNKCLAASVKYKVQVDG